MENNDKEKWIEEVLGSMKGNQRAKPGDDLFSKIQSQLEIEEAKEIPMRHWRYAAVAAVLLLVLNAFALRQYVQNNNQYTSEMVVTEVSDPSIISNYNIYE